MPGGSFGIFDWCVLSALLLAVLGVGRLASRRVAQEDEFFLAGRSMPAWAVALSVLGTSLSAATFLGGPESAYRGDFTYLIANAGALVAAFVVAFLFLPAYYRHGVTSVYELLGHRYGDGARKAASATFMIGRLMASGARLFIASIPFSLIVFGDLSPAALIVSVVVIAAVAVVYTVLGGIRAVIWTDVFQTVVLVGAVLMAAVLLFQRIPLSPAAIVDVLRAEDKLRTIDLSFDLTRPYTLWASLIGLTLFNVAAYGTDQDLAQRMLTCRDARSAAKSMLLSTVLSWPIVALFLLVGVLLYVLYEVNVPGMPSPATPPEDSRTVFLAFMLTELPPGWRGSMVAGLFAAAMSSTDSALNALASTTVADFVRSPDRDRTPRRELRLARIAVVAWALLLSLFAIGCVFWQCAGGDTLIDFALRVMVFAYGGLLGVYLVALLTRRGSTRSVFAALLTGFGIVTILEPALWNTVGDPPPPLAFLVRLAFPWKMVLATACSAAVCAVDQQRSH